LPDVVKKSRRPGYMVALAQAIKAAVRVPVIAAGRISSPARAEAILQDNKADLIGLARMLWVDPHWPQKARRGDDRKILNCNTKCDACLQLVMKGQPAICPRWPKEKRAAYRELFQ
jgi:2,4-dienoyl-CoA reductase (NADPH2)